MSATDTDREVLHACFEAARAHPFYREAYRDAAGIDDAPAIDKHVLLPALQAFSLRDEAHGVYLVRSGGSTQAPLVFPVDIAENHAQRAALAERLRAAGVFGPGTIALNVFGYSDLYRTAAIFDDLLERCDATSLPLSAHAPYADMLAAARRFAPTHVLGTPSKLALLAHYLAERGIALDIPQLLYGGEVLRAGTLALLRDTLGARQVWSLFGSAESGIWAWSDATRRPGVFETLPGVGVEVLDPDTDGYGALAISNGYRRRFPLFRYRSGDVGRHVEIDGRRHLELRGRDGRSFHFDELAYDLDTVAALLEGADPWQLLLSTDAGNRDCVAVLLTAGDEAFRARVTTRLERLFRRSADAGAITVRVVAPDALHLDPATAKTPAIVDLRR